MRPIVPVRGLGAALALVLAVSACRRFDGLPPTVSAEAVAAVTIGMSKAEVIALLGPPVEVELKSAEFYPAGSEAWKYSRDLKCSLCRYPRLWIHLDPSGKVEEVYLKENFWVDDRGVYGLAEGRRWGTTYPFLPGRPGG